MTALLAGERVLPSRLRAAAVAPGRRWPAGRPVCNFRRPAPIDSYRVSARARKRAAEESRRFRAALLGSDPVERFGRSVKPISIPTASAYRNSVRRVTCSGRRSVLLSCGALVPSVLAICSCVSPCFLRAPASACPTFRIRDSSSKAWRTRRFFNCSLRYRSQELGISVSPFRGLLRDDCVSSAWLRGTPCGGRPFLCRPARWPR